MLGPIAVSLRGGTDVTANLQDSIPVFRRSEDDPPSLCLAPEASEGRIVEGLQEIGYPFFVEPRLDEECFSIGGNYVYLLDLSHTGSLHENEDCIHDPASL